MPWVFALLFGIVSLANAAQDAQIVADDAPIFDRPEEAGLVLNRVPKGSPVRISERTRNGFYRVRLPAPIAGREYGWVRVADLTVESLKKSLKIAGISAADPVARDSFYSHFVLRGLYLEHGMKPSGASKYALGAGISAEFGYKLGGYWIVSAHLGTLSYSRVETGSTITASGLVLGAVADYLPWVSPPFRFAIGLGAGVSPGTTVGVLSQTSQAFLAPAGFGRLLLTWFFVPQFGLSLEAGYQYLGKKAVTVGATTVDAKLSSAFAGGGLQLEF